MSIPKYKLSVITINFNNKKGLEDTFKSVFEQTCKGLEYIVIDGGSSDGSRELIISHEDKISCWVSEPDKGIYNALNKGIIKATGDYILCLNSGDCFFEPTSLEKIMPFLNHDTDIVYGDAWCHNYANGFGDHIWHIPKELNFEYFASGGVLCHQSTIVKRELLLKNGLFSEDFKIASDWFFTLKALTYSQASYCHTNEVICRYDKSGFSSLNSKLYMTEVRTILRKYFSFFLKNIKINAQGNRINFKKLIKNLLPYGLVIFIQNYKSVSK